MRKIPVLETIDIWKRFPGVIALKGVSIKVYENEIVGLVGENGAGKSTFLKILGGILRKDSGKIYWMGREIEFKSPYEALENGVAYVPQEVSILGNLSLCENMFIGRENKSIFLPKDSKREIETCRKVFSELGIDIDPLIRGRDVGFSIAQLTLIARAVYFKSKLIMFDEPTSGLSALEVEKLLSIMTRLKSMGVSIIFVSHKIEEVMKVADRIYVLRDGVLVSEYPREQFNLYRIVRDMVAREVREFFPKEKAEIGSIAMEVRNLSDAAGFIKNVSFYVRHGEILGIYGIAGSGRTEMALTLIGFRPRKSGTIIIDGKSVEIRRPRDAINHGIGYLPEDWRLSLVLIMSMSENISLPIVDKLKIVKLGGLSPIDFSSELKISMDYVNKLRIVPPDIRRRTLYLSGGNKQKVALAKLLASRSKILILDEPTHGIDVSTKVEIRKLMCDIAKEGKAVILISSELPEIINMSDRILVMRDGTIAAEFSRDEASEEKIVRAAIL